VKNWTGIKGVKQEKKGKKRENKKIDGDVS